MPPPPLKHEQKEKQRGRHHRKFPDEKNDAKKKNWWKRVTGEKCDPITLEPFCEQTHAPFELLGKKFREQSYSSLLNDDEKITTKAARMMTTTTIQTSEKLQVKHLFDPESLAEYVVNAKTFENPLTRGVSAATVGWTTLRKFSLKSLASTERM